MEIVSNSNIPPLSSLPQWPRVGIVERTVATGKPREHKDREFVQVASQCEKCGGYVNTEGMSLGAANFTGLDVQDLTKHLDKSVQFLKAQQNELLGNLHEEVDRLKKENGELQYKLVMSTKPVSPEVNNLPKASLASKANDEVITRLRTEIEDLKNALEEAKKENGLLEKVLDQQSSLQGASMDDIGDDAQQQMQLSMHSRALEHCDRIIKHLQSVNEQQAAEVTRLKAELKDLLSTYRPAPDIGLLSSRNKKFADEGRLPKLASEAYNHRPFSPEVVPTTNRVATTNPAQSGHSMIVTNSLVPRPPSQPPPFSQTESTIVSAIPPTERSKGTIHLPPLKQVVPSRIAERKKQIEVLHKARLRQLSSNVKNPTNNNS